jgi:multiple sugar transport system permease protein
MQASGIKPLGKEKYWLAVMLTPTIIGLIFGAFGSVLATLLISFTDWDLLTPPKWLGLANYTALFNDEKFLTPLLNTDRKSVV